MKSRKKKRHGQAKPFGKSVLGKILRGAAALGTGGMSELAYHVVKKNNNNQEKGMFKNIAKKIGNVSLAKPLRNINELQNTIKNKLKRKPNRLSYEDDLEQTDNQDDVNEGLNMAEYAKRKLQADIEAKNFQSEETNDI